MKLITLDFETFFDKEYNLRKLSTEEYIRDPRFEVMGVGVKVGAGKTEWFTGDDFRLRAFLARFDWANSAVLAHNTAFDGAILAWRFGIKAKFYLDTLSMGRPRHMHTCGVSLAALAKEYDLGEKGQEVHNFVGIRREAMTPVQAHDYGVYCANDVDLTYDLFKAMSHVLPQDELKSIDQVLRMFIEPKFELDKAVLTEHLAAVQKAKADLMDDLNARYNGDVKPVLMSNPKFAEALKELGVEPPTKLSKANNKVTWAFAKTDQEFLALQHHPDPKVQALMAARLGVKSTIEETRTENFISIANRGLLPAFLNYWGAHTSRFSGGDDTNLQNLPRGGTLRKALVAPKGYKVVAADLAQIEARLVAYMAGQDDLVQAFRDERDVYAEFATEVYGYPINKVDHPLERFVGKTGILGLGYYCGPPRFRDMLAIGSGGMSHHIELDESKRIVQLYRRKNHKIASLWYKSGKCLDDMVRGGMGAFSEFIPVCYAGSIVTLPNGTFLTYPELSHDGSEIKYTSRKKRIKLYSGKIVENITQALAAAIIRDMMLTIGKRYFVALQVHDEIVCIVKDEEVGEATEWIKGIMAIPPTWAPNLPIKGEIGVGQNYGDAKN